MPLDANPSNSKNGVAVTAAQFDETDHNKVDNDTPDNSGADVVLDPQEALDAFDSGESYSKPLVSQTNKNTQPKKTITEVKKEDENQETPEVDSEETETETSEEDTETDKEKSEEEVEDQEIDPKNKEVLEKDSEKKDDPKVPKGERDYSDFTPEEVQWLKKCDNRAFSVLSNKIKEHKAAFQKAEAERLNLHKIVNEKAIPLEYYQHPRAYTLTPEYEQEATNFGLVQREREHFRSQLLKIRKGEQWTDLEGWDKHGNPVYSKTPQEPTEEAALDLQERIAEAGHIQGQIQGKIAAMANAFKERHEADTKAIIQAVEHHVSKLHEGFKPEQKHIDAALEMLPKSKRSDPLAQSVAKMYGVIAKLAMALQNKTAAAKTQAAKNNDDKEAGVRTTNLPKGGSNGSKGSKNGMINYRGKMIPAEYDPNNILLKNGDDE